MDGAATLVDLVYFIILRTKYKEKKMKKVLVTGASGRVGANVVRQLSHNGVPVRAMVMPHDHMASKIAGIQGVEIVEADMGDQGSITKAVKGCSDVIHLAVQLIRNGTPVDRYFDINSFGTLRLLEGIVAQGGIDRFVLVSTDGTYRPGNPTEVPLKENSPQLPGDYYGTSKLLGEVITTNWAAQYDIPYSIVRFATVISPEESLKYFRYESVMELLSRAYLGKDTNIWQLFSGQPDMASILKESVHGDGNPGISLVGPDGDSWSMHVVDVRDAVQGVLLAYSHPNALNNDFFIASSYPTTFREGGEIISRTLKVPFYEVSMPRDWKLEIDITKAKMLLGYEPQWTFEKMVNSGLNANESDKIMDFIPNR